MKLAKRWVTISVTEFVTMILLVCAAPSAFNSGRPNLGFLMFGTAIGLPLTSVGIESRRVRRAKRSHLLLSDAGVNVSLEEVFAAQLAPETVSSILPSLKVALCENPSFEECPLVLVRELAEELVEKK
jgi:hypothetical protein